MTESDWLTSSDWLKLWFHSREVGLRTERKTRLFAAAGCRSIARWLYDPRCLRAVEVCEDYADGLVGVDELEAACDGARFENGPPVQEQRTVIGDLASAATHWICYAEYKVGRSAEVVPGVHGYAAVVRASVLAEDATAEGNDCQQHPAYREGVEQGKRLLADILREVIGNPARVATLESPVRTPAVLALAQAAYEKRTLPSGLLDPILLGILADALEEAGCDNADVLGHLRGPGPHWRGCWALDVVMEKS